MLASFLEFTLDLVRIFEQAIQRLAEHFFLGPAEQPVGALVPASHQAR
jgi:hypothetical protein